MISCFMEEGVLENELESADFARPFGWLVEGKLIGGYIWEAVLTCVSLAWIEVMKDDWLCMNRICPP